MHVYGIHSHARYVRTGVAWKVRSTFPIYTYEVGMHQTKSNETHISFVVYVVLLLQLPLIYQKHTRMGLFALTQITH